MAATQTADSAAQADSNLTMPGRDQRKSSFRTVTGLGAAHPLAAVKCAGRRVTTKPSPVKAEGARIIVKLDRVIARGPAPGQGGHLPVISWRGWEKMTCGGRKSFCDARLASDWRGNVAELALGPGAARRHEPWPAAPVRVAPGVLGRPPAVPEPALHIVPAAGSSRQLSSTVNKFNDRSAAWQQYVLRNVTQVPSKCRPAVPDRCMRAQRRDHNGVWCGACQWTKRPPSRQHAEQGLAP